jgi:hypothetical protein
MMAQSLLLLTFQVIVTARPGAAAAAKEGMKMNNKNDSSEHAAKQLQKMRRRVDALMRGGAPKRLKDRPRLVAASHVGRLVKAASDSGHSMTKLCEILGENMPSKPGRTSVEPFRLHRWMLKGGATEVTEELVTHYHDRPEPQRSTTIYLRLMEHLGKLSGRDPLECQGALLTALDLLDGRVQNSEDGFLPEQRIADLLHEYAAVIARRFDLAQLFQQAERVQAGWNIQRGPDVVVDLVPESTGSFLAREPVDRQYWLETASPPLPSVAIARLPFGFLPGPFHLTNEAGETRERPGYAAAYWDLHLAVGPSGPLSVGAYLLRGTSVDLVLDGDTIRLPDQQEDIDQIISGRPQAPQIFLDGTAWKISCETQSFYRPQRPGLDDSPPSDEMPNTRIDPISASSVREWMMTSFDLLAEGGTWIPVEDRFESKHPPAAGWVRTKSIARNLEVSLREGWLDEHFKNWLDRFRPNLDRFEQDWIDRTIKQDTALRQHYLNSDLTGEDS